MSHDATERDTTETTVIGWAYISEYYMHVFYKHLYLHLGLCLRPLLSKSVKKFINTKQVIKNGEKTVNGLRCRICLIYSYSFKLQHLWFKKHELCMHSSCINLQFCIVCRPQPAGRAVLSESLICISLLSLIVKFCI